jgi:heptosyltransferase-2
VEVLSDLGINPGKPIAAIHPGGYYESQRWPAERYGLVARKLTEEFSANVIIFCGPDEKHLLSEILRISGDNVHGFTELSVRQLMAMLSKCDLFLGNNSGPLHLSAALGLPTVSLLGPTVVPLWLPWGKGHIVLRKEELRTSGFRDIANQRGNLKSITVDEVLEAVGSQLRSIESS